MVEEFVHQGLVVFGSCLNEFLVKLGGLIHIFFRNISDSGHATVGTPRILFHQQHVDHRIEAGTAFCRELNSHNLVAEVFTHLGHNVVVVGFFAVKLVERKDYGFVQVLCCAENVLCAYFNAILAVDKDNTGIRYVECSDGIAYEVVAAWAVDNIKFLVQEFSVEHC